MKCAVTISLWHQNRKGDFTVKYFVLQCKKIRKIEEKVQFNVTKNSKNLQFNVKKKKSNRTGDFTDKYLVRSLRKNRVQFNFENPKKIHSKYLEKNIR